MADTNITSSVAKEPKFDFDEVYKKLSESFPTEALSSDKSRGFDLTSVKAQYIIERLNETLGIDGWSHRGKYVEVEGGIIYEGALVVDNGIKAVMQESVGFSTNKKNIGDSYKSAKTDSLSKCASLFGVANDVYKGKVKVKAPKKAVTSVTTGDF